MPHTSFILIRFHWSFCSSCCMVYYSVLIPSCSYLLSFHFDCWLFWSNCWCGPGHYACLSKYNFSIILTEFLRLLWWYRVFLSDPTSQPLRSVTSSKGSSSPPAAISCIKWMPLWSTTLSEDKTSSNYIYSSTCSMYVVWYYISMATSALDTTHSWCISVLSIRLEIVFCRHLAKISSTLWCGRSLIRSVRVLVWYWLIWWPAWRTSVSLSKTHWFPQS